MNQSNKDNASDVIKSLANAINKKIISPQDEKITCIDKRTQFTEEEFNRQLNNLEERFEELKLAQKRMGILCISLSLAIIVCIVVQVI